MAVYRDHTSIELEKKLSDRLAICGGSSTELEKRLNIKEIDNVDKYYFDGVLFYTYDWNK